MQIKSLVRFPVDIRRARRLLAEERWATDSFAERPICLDLRTSHLLFDCGRHFASLAHYSRAAGSAFFVRCSPLMLASIARKIHGREMLAEPYVRWLSPDQPLPANSLVLRDHSRSAAGLEMLIGKDSIDGVPTMPYPMHPATLPFADADSLRKYRSTEKRARIFFAGNQKTKYGQEKITRDFGYLSRLAVLETIRNRYRERVLASATAPDLTRESIVLADSRLEPIDASQWLATLARFDFFVCCPGAAQPTCHNLIEAMSVGTIPLIEYGSRVTPALRDGVNAILFRGESGLVDAIGRIDQLTDAERNSIRDNAAIFFDEHLCGTRFLGELRDRHGKSGQAGRPGSVSPTKVCMPFHDRNLFDFNTLQRSVAA